MLDRLDASRLRVLVIQYTDNDLLENRAYKTNGNHLPIMSAAQYQQHRAALRLTAARTTRASTSFVW